MEFAVKVWPKGQQIALRNKNIITELRPDELHIKPDGDLNDKPTLCFLLRGAGGEGYVAQISERMLREGLNKCEQVRELLG